MDLKWASKAKTTVILDTFEDDKEQCALVTAVAVATRMLQLLMCFEEGLGLVSLLQWLSDSLSRTQTVDHGDIYLGWQSRPPYFGNLLWKCYPINAIWLLSVLWILSNGAFISVWWFTHNSVLPHSLQMLKGAAYFIFDFLETKVLEEIATANVKESFTESHTKDCLFQYLYCKANRLGIFKQFC